ncbi:MAG: hypothetical protein KJ062_08900 [Thermoanaerobaculia bacterium]|nr:hypothetical protein [Thermoanaerobaculia bacterium]
MGGAAKPPGPAGADKPAEGLRGPAGLAEGEQAAQGPPKLDPPSTALSSKVFSYFDDQVRILVCLMPHPAASKETLVKIRAATNSEVQIGYTDAALTMTDIKETKVAGKSWFTAVGKLAASKMAVPSDLWVDDTKIKAEKDAKELRRLNRFRKAYEDILLHEQKHMTEAFRYLTGDSLGFKAAFGSESSTLPDKARFTEVAKAAQTTAAADTGPIRSSAKDWDDKDLSDLRSRQRELYVTIDPGKNPKIHYHPPRDE